jgi:peroxiredoxin Q/BCP
MAQLRVEYRKFVERNTEIIAIGPEDSESFADWWHKNQMPFIGIADPEHVIANLYGQQVKLFKLGRMPASILIDKNGQIRYSHYGDSMADIPQSAEILKLIDELNNEDADKV